MYLHIDSGIRLEHFEPRAKTEADAIRSMYLHIDFGIRLEHFELRTKTDSDYTKPCSSIISSLWVYHQQSVGRQTIRIMFFYHQQSMGLSLVVCGSADYMNYVLLSLVVYGSIISSLRVGRLFELCSSIISRVEQSAGRHRDHVQVLLLDYLFCSEQAFY